MCPDADGIPNGPQGSILVEMSYFGKGFCLFFCCCLTLFQETFGKLQRPKLKSGCSDFCLEVYLLPKFKEEITSLTVGQGVWGCGDAPP